MKLQQCVNCKKQFSWREQEKSTRNLFVYPEIECTNCLEINKLTVPFYVLHFLLRAFPLVGLFFLFEMEISKGITTVIFLISVAIILYIEPFLVTYRKMER